MPDDCCIGGSVHPAIKRRCARLGDHRAWFCRFSGSHCSCCVALAVMVAAVAVIIAATVASKAEPTPRFCFAPLPPPHRFTRPASIMIYLHDSAAMDPHHVLIPPPSSRHHSSAATAALPPLHQVRRIADTPRPSGMTSTHSSGRR